MSQYVLPNVWNEPFASSITDSLKMRAASLFRQYQLPENKEEWLQNRASVYEGFAKAMRLKIDHDLPLDHTETGVIECGGYTVRKVAYRAAKDRIVTGNLYVPAGEGPFPAVLNMHGHHYVGRLAERVQMRGHVLAKQGFVCLCVDAIGAGERATVHGKGEYHGSYKGASLFNVGETLMGVQVADNMRGIDLLCSLPYVDSDRIGAIGASGGGNQTMWLMAMDDRIKAAAPVVSSGTFDVYTRTVNCWCEVCPGGLTVGEESALVALIAPRAYMMCNVLEDNDSFCIREMMRTYKEARKVFRACGADNQLTYRTFPGRHGFWPEILEAVLGFLTYHLKGEGSMMPMEIPQWNALPEKDVMVWEAGKQPEDLKSLKRYCHDRAEQLNVERQFDAEKITSQLDDILSGVNPLSYFYAEEIPETQGWKRYMVQGNNNMPVNVLFRKGANDVCRILASDMSKTVLQKSEILRQAMESGDSVMIFDPCGCGERGERAFSMAEEHDFHNLARHIAWFGDSLFGIWCQEYTALKMFAEEEFGIKEFVFCGLRDAGLAAICAGVLSNGVKKVIAEGSITSFDLMRGDCKNAAVSMAAAVPDILLAGDVSTFAALAGDEVIFLDPLHVDGTPLTAEEKAAFAGQCRKEAGMMNVNNKIKI